MGDNELSFYFAECTVCGDMADYDILGNFYCENCYLNLIDECNHAEEIS